MSEKRGIIIVISSPSGCGKSTIANKILSRDSKIKLSISVTTREKRAFEEDGVDYHFISKDKFYNMIENESLLEYAVIYDNLYGTPVAPVLELLDQGTDVLFDVDIQGAEQISSSPLADRVIKIYLLPPSMKELKSRLENRGSDSQEVIEKRFNLSKQEITYFDKYDYVIVNNDSEISFESIYNIINIERSKVCNNILNITKFVEELINESV